MLVVCVRLRATLLVGVLLRRLMDDPSLAGVTHVVVDEVHERSLDSDLLLLLLRAALREGAAFRVVLMSATVDADLFAGYFATQGDVPSVLQIPGRTFPVRDLYLEDAIAAMVARGRRPGRAARDALDTVCSATTLCFARHTLSQDIVTRYGEAVAQAVAGVDQQHVPYDVLVDLVAHIVSVEAAEGPGALLRDWVPEGAAATAPTTMGAILIFLPGAEEISRLVRMMHGALLGIDTTHHSWLAAARHPSLRRRAWPEKTGAASPPAWGSASRTAGSGV